MSSIRLHNFFWMVCGVSLLLSLTSIYVFIVVMNLGYVGMILGLAVKFFIESSLYILIIFKRGEKAIFVFPRGEIFSDMKDIKEIMKFSLNYAVGYYTVTMTFELISLILIKTEGGKANLMIWVALAQIINAVYYIGYGISSYGRALATHFIGTGNIERYRDSLYKCLKYHSITTYIINIPFFIFAPWIGELLLSEEAHVREFTLCLRVLSFFLPLDSMLPLLNSYLRLLGHNFFSAVLMFSCFALLITLISIVLCLVFDFGAFGPTIGLCFCNIVVSTLALLRIYINLDFYLKERILDTQMKSESNAELTEEASNVGTELVEKSDCGRGKVLLAMETVDTSTDMD